MIEGKCEKCGTKHYGYALIGAEKQACSNCGGNIILADSHQNVKVKSGDSDKSVGA